jgi:hypothetical protein
MGTKVSTVTAMKEPDNSCAVSVPYIYLYIVNCNRVLAGQPEFSSGQGYWGFTLLHHVQNGSEANPYTMGTGTLPWGTEAGV